MDLRRLSYFVTLANELHFGRAAAILHIAQPALSQQIKILERECGAPLFERKSHGTQLTPAGSAILPYAQDLVRHAEQVADNIKAISSGRSGRIRVAQNRSIPEVGPTVFDAFQKRYPDITIEVFDVGWTTRNCELVRNGEVDVGFVRLPLVDSEGLHELRLGTSEIVIAVPPDHPFATLDEVPVEAVARENTVIWSRRKSPGAFDYVVQTIWGTRPPTILNQAGDASFVFAEVKAGAGIGLVYRARAAMLAPTGVVLKRFTKPAPEVGFGLVWADTPYISSPVQRLVTFAADHSGHSR